MGDMLNNYRNMTFANASTFSKNKEAARSRELPQPSPIDIFEIDAYIPLIELESFLSKDRIFPKGKKLFEFLSNLSPQARVEKILEYNKEVEKAINKRGGTNGSLEFGISALEDTVGIISGFPLSGSIFSLLKPILSKKIASSTAVAKFKNRLEESIYQKNPDRANINFLTEINRVARLRRF